MSKWKDHKAKWKDCQLCELCQTRERVVLYRGKIPCDVLLIGEAPGLSEDIEGKPFHGPAGHLLNKMIEDAGGDRVRLGFTNLIACIPIDPNTRHKVQDPEPEHIKACGDRLKEIYKIARPKVTLAVGKLSGKWVPKILRIDPYEEIIHPAAILRANGQQKGLAIQKTIVALRDLFNEFH